MRIPFAVALLGLGLFASTAASAQPYHHGPGYRPAPPLHELYRDRFGPVTGLWAAEQLWNPSERRTIPLPRDVRVDVAIRGGGEMSISTGCNTINTRLITRGRDTFTAPAASTRRACPGRLGVIEQAFHSALPSIRGYYSRDRHRLVFIDGRGRQLLTLRSIVR